MIGKENKNNGLIIADSAEPKSIAELREYGLKIVGARKGPDSVDYGIKFLQDLEEIVIDSERCPNAAREFLNYELEKDKDGNFKADFPDKNNHCLTGDTIINTPNGDFYIKDLVGKKGKIYCFDEINNKPTVSEFYDVRLTNKNVDVYEIELEDGRTIKATDYHPILTDKGWKLLKDLTEGDKILDISNHVQKHVQIDYFQDYLNYVKIKRIRYIGKQNVYNMEVKDYHNFSVNGGLIVHNCIDATRYALEDDMKNYGVRKNYSGKGRR